MYNVASYENSFPSQYYAMSVVRLFKFLTVADVERKNHSELLEPIWHITCFSLPFSRRHLYHCSRNLQLSQHGVHAILGINNCKHVHISEGHEKQKSNLNCALAT